MKIHSEIISFIFKTQSFSPNELYFFAKSFVNSLKFANFAAE